MTVLQKIRELSSFTLAATFAGCLGVLALTFSVASPASAAGGPLAEFTGSWSGTGTLRPTGGAAERIRCKADYRPRGSTGHEIELRLRCASDSYNFDLKGVFTADEKNQVTGQWTEQTRNVGGIAIGQAQGERMQLHTESSGFSADVGIVTRGHRQSVNIDSQGGGQIIKASITLSRS